MVQGRPTLLEQRFLLVAKRNDYFSFLSSYVLSLCYAGKYNPPAGNGKVTSHVFTHSRELFAIVILVYSISYNILIVLCIKSHIHGKHL